jgi:hypothetical protein
MFVCCDFYEIWFKQFICFFYFLRELKLIINFLLASTVSVIVCYVGKQETYTLGSDCTCSCCLYAVFLNFRLSQRFISVRNLHIDDSTMQMFY